MVTYFAAYFVLRRLGMQKLENNFRIGKVKDIKTTRDRFWKLKALWQSKDNY
jgi:hypothetical protein